MIKRIIIICILIYLITTPNVYGTEEIISSQMDALNLSSVIKEGESYTKDAFPDINLNELLNSAIKGEINNKQVFKNLFYILGDEIVSAISVLGSILVVIVIHSLLKNFTDNLNNGEGIGQITYYVEYILIVTLIMANFSNIINMIKESISNLVGFVNSLVPIVLALMSASREYSICFINTTTNYICSSFYRECYNSIHSTNYFSCNCIRYSIKFIR